MSAQIPKAILSIAIDGPSGAGKSSVAASLAEMLAILHLDTGAMYRAVGLLCLEAGIDTNDEADVVAYLSKIDLEILYENSQQQTIGNGRNLNEFIRTPEVARAGSNVSKFLAVRQWLVALQQELARKNSLIMDGRDIGTVVLPQASCKFFLTASPEIRAQRRYKQLQDRDRSVNYDYEAILAETIWRDQQDSQRLNSPTRQAEDAIFLDSSLLTEAEVLTYIIKVLKDRGLWNSL